MFDHPFYPSFIHLFLLVLFKIYSKNSYFMKFKIINKTICKWISLKFFFYLSWLIRHQWFWSLKEILVFERDFGVWRKNPFKHTCECVDLFTFFFVTFAINSYQRQTTFRVCAIIMLFGAAHCQNVSSKK